MKVSIILPIYNVEKYIAGCIASIAAQTYGDYDVIAVDDCCQDNSIEAMKDAMKKENMAESKVRIIRHDKNRGLSAARNTGIKASEADYVYFLDSDDTISPDCIELLVEAINKHSKAERAIDMAIGDYAFDGPNIGCPKLSTTKELLTQKEYIKEYCKEHVYPMAWNRLVRRQFITKNNLFFEEGLIHEDTLWNFALLKHIGYVATVNKETYIYKVRPNSIQSSDDFEKHFKANSYIVGKLCDIQFSTRILKYNKYVYNFVEQEKLRHLYDCYRSGNMKLVPQLYSICRHKPHLMPWQAKLLCFPHTKRINARDMHYSESYEQGLNTFARLPETL